VRRTSRSVERLPPARLEVPAAAAGVAAQLLTWLLRLQTSLRGDAVRPAAALSVTELKRDAHVNGNRVRSGGRSFHARRCLFYKQTTSHGY
jgi:hypothetical protein